MPSEGEQTCQVKGFQSIAQNLQSSLRPCQVALEAKIVFVIILRHHLPSSLFLTFAKAMLGKTAGILPEINTVAPNCTSAYCILHQHALPLKKKMSVSLKNLLSQLKKAILLNLNRVHVFFISVSK